jgi:CIC family chloride channel protein
LFIGSLLGKTFAVVLPQLSPNLALDPMTSMLAGMATLGVAVIGGPLTMSFLVLETTRNLEVTAGVLAACIVASVFVRGVFGYSFSTWRLHLRGETIRSANDVGWMRTLTVDRMMRSDAQVAAAGSTVADCRKRFSLGSRRAIFVVDDFEHYCGVVLLLELFSSDLDTQAEQMKIVELVKLQDAFLYRHMNIKDAMKCFEQAEAEILAVLESSVGPKVVGMLTESYAMRRYTEELDQATRGFMET